MDVTVNNALATWDLLEKHLESFSAAWEQGEPPPLAEHLPAGPPVLRKLALVEMIKVDLEYRAASQQLLQLEQYLTEFPELVDSAGPPCDLIYEEFHVRRANGESIAPSEYYRRFPQRRDELERLLGVGDVSQTTALYAERRPQDLHVGDTIDDFNLMARLGQGAFGAVFLAWQQSMGRLVALKASADKGQEARTLAQLDHQNIIRVYDQRRLPEKKLRLVYMQFASGGTLAEVVSCIRMLIPEDRSGRHLVECVQQSSEKAGMGPTVDPRTLESLAQQSWPEVVGQLGIQLAQALDYAHRQGILHRDVKPANILLAADGTPKLADFNISAQTNSTSHSAAAYFGGSLAYMSPEHLEAFNPKHGRKADELDGRADLYSLAVVLWELLTGEKPFYDTKVDDDWARTLAEMTERRKKCEFQMPMIGGDETSSALLDILKRCLSPDPSERPATGAELAQELRLCIQPQTQGLIRVSSRGWRQWALRFPVWFVLVVVTIPNVLVGVVNYLYNDQIIDQHPNPRVHDAFFLVQFIINGVAFPVGAYLVYCFVRPVARMLKSPTAIREATPEQRSIMRQKALRLGHWAALIGIVEWMIAGVIYPVAMYALTEDMGFANAGHFIISLALCGLVAAAYPFFGVTYVAVRVFFPALLPKPTIDPRVEAQLRRLSVETRVYYAIACGVPLIGMGLLILLGSDYRTAQVVLTVLIALGVFFASYTMNVIQRDITSLLTVVRPAETFGLESTTHLRR